MDSNHQEQSTSQHEEGLDPQSGNLLGIGRLYGCEFCKRGFNTAQALGGHMNIHRSTRDHRAAKKKPTSTNLTRKSQGKYHLDFAYRDDWPSSSVSTESSLASMGPGSKISSFGINFFSDHSRANNEDCDISESGLGYGPGLLLGEKKEMKKVGQYEKNDEVDLELRLGL